MNELELKMKVLLAHTRRTVRMTEETANQGGLPEFCGELLKPPRHWRLVAVQHL
jgi:hypothetical protein